jgi:hypothetical protein
LGSVRFKEELEAEVLRQAVETESGFSPAHPVKLIDIVTPVIIARLCENFLMVTAM